MQKRVTYWAVFLLVTAIGFTGCTTRAGSGSMIERDENDFYVDLPAVVIEYASNGTASIGGLSFMDLENDESANGVELPTSVSLGLATTLSAASLSPFWIQNFTASNIQHMQVNNGVEGIYLMVNGRQIPSLVWEEGSLLATADAVSALGIGVPAINRVLPLVQKLGLGLVLQFPVAEGNELIPLTGVKDSEEVLMARLAQEQFLQVFGTPPSIDLPILYHSDGSWTLGELSDVDWTVLTSTPFYALRLPPAVVSGLTDAGVQTVSLQTDREGIHIAVNGTGLPYLSWGNGEIQNVLALTEQLGILDGISGLVPGGDLGSIMGLVE